MITGEDAIPQPPAKPPSSTLRLRLRQQLLAGEIQDGGRLLRVATIPVFLVAPWLLGLALTLLEYLGMPPVSFAGSPIETAFHACGAILAVSCLIVGSSLIKRRTWSRWPAVVLMGVVQVIFPPAVFMTGRAFVALLTENADFYFEPTLTPRSATAASDTRPSSPAPPGRP